MRRQVHLIHRATGVPYRSVYLGAADTLYDALERSGVPIRTVCRGSTICGVCRVTVEAGADVLEPPRPDEAALLQRFAVGEPRARLACRITLPEGVDAITVSTDYWGAEPG